MEDPTSISSASHAFKASLPKTNFPVLLGKRKSRGKTLESEGALALLGEEKGLEVGKLQQQTLIEIIEDTKTGIPAPSEIDKKVPPI